MKEITSLEEFNNIIENNITALVLFSMDSCADCLQFLPTIQELEKEYLIYIVDVDKNSNIYQQRLLTAVPTLLIFKNGVEYQRIIGKRTFEELKKEFKIVYE